jgi:ubiquinone/menaquinone biosynthesis C-methylase UbiE
MTTVETHKSVLKEYFSSTIDQWHGLYEGEDFIHRHMIDRREIVLGLVEKYSNGEPMRLLDLGSGTGILTLELIKRRKTVIALDCTKEMISKLKEEMVALGQGMGEALVGDGEMTCFKDGTFTGIVCIGVLQYQRKDDVILREIARLLLPKGFSVFSIPNVMRLNYLLDPLYYCRLIKRSLERCRKREMSSRKRNIWDADGGDTTDRSYPINRKYVKWQLDKVLEGEGLRIKEIVGFGFGPLTFWGKAVLPDDVSWKMSRFLDRYANRWRVLKALSNRWVFVVEKR